MLCYTKLMQRKTFAFIALSFIIWRFILFIPVFAAEKKLDYRPGYEYTSITDARNSKDKNITDKLLLSPWANFDGLHYITIASSGYTNNYGFFPLFPSLINLVSKFLGGSETFDYAYFFSGFLISNLAFLLSLLVFYKLLSLDYSDKQVKTSILALLLFPASFFFGSIYSESLFLLLLLVSFYFARKKQWLLASFFGSLLTLTRFVGICIFPILIYEFYKSKDWSIKNFIKSGIWATPAGLVLYSIYNQLEEGNFLYFIKVQGNFLNNRSVDSFIFFGQTIYRYIKIIITTSSSHFEWWIALLEIVSFIFIALVIIYALKKRVRFSYILFSFLAVLIPASSGTFSALPRYILVAFITYIVIGVTNKKIKILYFSISAVLLFILTFFFSRGYFIS